ncbi:MAG: metallophosphoesterase [Verrucomicrobiae bacterium]|nr:metallophosphoesterase [Verrucomicrobiae bacterium]
MKRLLPLIIAVLIVAGWPPFFARAAESVLSPAPEGSFSIVVIPDTQHYLGRGTKAQPTSTNEVTNSVLDTHTRWVVDNLQRQRIVFVTHVGDLVDRNVPDQWAVARRCMDRLHNRVPYGIAPGNHDMKDDGNTSLFQAHFGAARFAGMPWYGGAFNHPGDPAISGNGANSFQLFSAAGMEFVILHLECNAPDDVLAWAGGVLDTHSKRRAIVTTHMGLGPLQKPKRPEDFVTAPKGRMQWKKTHGACGNTPQQMWDKCFRRHANLFLILSGDQSRTQAMRLVSTNDHGKPVHEVLSDYMQDRDGYWLRICRFLPAANRIEVKTFDSRDGRLCPGTKLLPDAAQHQFSIACEMTPIQP